jgi:hypothetical protein
MAEAGGPMAERGREFGEFVRRSLHAAAGSVMISQDGLDRIRIRLAATAAGCVGADPPGPRKRLSGRRDWCRPRCALSGGLRDRGASIEALGVAGHCARMGVLRRRLGDLPPLRVITALA